MAHIKYQRHKNSAPKIAVITGGGTGLGQAIARQLALQNLTVFIIGRRARKLKETQAFSPQHIIPIAADISTARGRARIAEKLKNMPIDYVIHNAAIAFPIAPIEKITLRAFRAIFSTNLEAPLFLTQLLLPQLKPKARILHISSDCAHYPLAYWIPYCTSKAALLMLKKCLQKEFKLHKNKPIYIGSIDPGIMDTPMQQAILDKHVIFPEKMTLHQLKQRKLLLSADFSAQTCVKLLLHSSPKAFQDAN